MILQAGHGELCGELFDSLSESGETSLDIFVVHALLEVLERGALGRLVDLNSQLEALIDEIGHDQDFRLFEVARGESGRADANAARVEGALVARACVLVAGDRDLLEDLFGLAAV